ncbi:MAG TPA: hypothetical protein VF380_07790 [Solirubrobacteraceae bacterium]
MQITSNPFQRAAAAFIVLGVIAQLVGSQAFGTALLGIALVLAFLAVLNRRRYQR